MENINIIEIINKCEHTMVKDIKVIDICNLFEIIWPDYFSNINLYLEREEEFAKLVRPGIGKDYNYYADCKEDFSIFKAVRKTKEKNLNIVIVENMS